MPFFCRQKDRQGNHCFAFTVLQEHIFVLTILVLKIAIAYIHLARLLYTSHIY